MGNSEINIYDIAQNRELSWLKFNERVLKTALDPLVPLYEKLKFISIFISNLDEFFMVRVGSITDLSLLKNGENDSKTGMSPQEQLDAIFEACRPLYQEKDMIYQSVHQVLRETGIEDVKIHELTSNQLEELDKYYRYYLEPVLSPMIIDSYHPFPFIENLQFALISEISSDLGEKIALLPIPQFLERVYYFKNADNHRFIRLENIIKYYFEELYEKWEVSHPTLIRITRNADVTLEADIADEDVDYRQYMRKILKKRKRLQTVRVEADRELTAPISKALRKNFEISKEQIFVMSSPMEISYIFSMAEHMGEEFISTLSFEPFSPKKNPNLDMNQKLLPQVKEKDIMLIYPYEDIGQFVAILDEAANDPNVLSIKITIYRLSDNSKIAYSLMRAAENGKDVTALMELRARFDEEHNIDYSEQLINAGVNVIYGIENYKCHSKICLITRKGPRGLEYTTQIGTGNYNESTSKLYTDCSLITSDEVIARDAIDFFNDMQTGNLEGNYEKLLASPHTLKDEFLRLIDEEIEKGEEGRLYFKFNSLTDKDFIEKFAEASQAGVQVRLMIRGICCIVPDIEGFTENVEVRSIVGRFLEHPRIYIFGQGDEKKYYISSADLMTRNTERRVEIASPVEDPELKEKIDMYMEMQWEDNQKARVLHSDGEYGRVHTNRDDSFSSQDGMMEYAIENSNKFEPLPEKKSWLQSIGEFFGKLFGGNN